MTDFPDRPVQFTSLSDQPIYNIKAVCQRTGITIATLRAWERRYGIPAPQRAEQGFRLYSERDIAIVYWLLQQTQAGVNISQAVHYLQSRLHSEPNLELMLPPPIRWNGPASYNEPRSPDVLYVELVEAFVGMDRDRAEALLAEAAALYTLETALVMVLHRALRTLREQYREGNLPGGALHIAHTLARQHLLGTMPHQASTRPQQLVILIGFAQERTECDLLILNLLLKRQGLQVSYLGDSVDPHLLMQERYETRKSLLVFLIDDPDHAPRLIEIMSFLRQHSYPCEAVCCGSLLNDHPKWQDQLQLDYLGDDLRSVFAAIVERATTIR